MCKCRVGRDLAESLRGPVQNLFPSLFCRQREIGKPWIFGNTAEIGNCYCSNTNIDRHYYTNLITETKNMVHGCC
jgi:hypothetical protein